jgi:hypothetical protein
VRLPNYRIICVSVWHLLLLRMLAHGKGCHWSTSSIPCRLDFLLSHQTALLLLALFARGAGRSMAHSHRSSGAWPPGEIVGEYIDCNRR